MRVNYPYLQDTAFLYEFDRTRLKEQYVKLTVLNFAEDPLQAIEGRTISGNINLDGNSAVRRTCNLNVLARESENNLTGVENLFSINKKVSVDIGFKNMTNSYIEHDIIWFPQGVFVIMGASISRGLQGTTISLQLKDKMCLLNGDCGGTIPASTTLHEYETINEDGEYVIVQPTIDMIIRELVNHFGGEQLSKIVINDIDSRVKQVMKWIGNTPIYISEQEQKAVVDYNLTLGDASYKMYEYGDDIGYIYTDFTYPGELIADAGASVCKMLDKIKNTLGNYEYFYDVWGNFIFQEKKNYLNKSHSQVVSDKIAETVGKTLDQLDNNDYLLDMSNGKAVYEFKDGAIITAYSNSPQYNMIKNDFIVWGIRESATGIKIPVRYHLAIDSKPRVGQTYECFLYEDENELLVAKVPLKFSNRQAFPRVGQAEVFYLAVDTGVIYKWNGKIREYEIIPAWMEELEATDWRTALYLEGSAAEPLGSESNYYYAELKNEWPKLYDMRNGKFFQSALDHPMDIDFYLDFIDSQAAISALSVSNIGRRTKVVNDDSVNCVFEPYIPNLVLIENNTAETLILAEECRKKNQPYVQIDGGVYSGISAGGSFNSAYNLVRELLYQYTSYNETVNLTMLPMYYLEPNIRISIQDVESDIYGDYMINSISVPLDASGTMSVSCTRALERI